MSEAHALPESDLSIRQLIDGLAENQPEQIFLIDPETGQQINFRESKERIISFANMIRGRGITSGSPVAYAFSNSLDGALAILGILYGGYLATAINLVAGESTITYVLNHSGTKLVICDDGGLKTITSSLEQAEADLETFKLSEPLAAAANLGTHHADETDDGLLMYTSGTTGRPKGVVLTQSNLIAGGTNTATAHELTAKDRGLCVLPFYHINAFCVSLMGALVTGGSLVIPQKFSTSSFWNLIRKHNCSWFSVVPTQISYLLHNADKPDGSSEGCDHLRFGRSASAPLSPEMHEAFEKRFRVPVIETMGLTETAAPILSNPLPPLTRKIGSPGIAYGNDVIIADEFQDEVSRGTEGEILVRGRNVLRCYLKNETATNEAITKDGWLRTGDLGRMDEEGYVFVTGRLKELIIKGGENIAPREIDEALYSHPDIIEAAAFPVACDNYGQRVEAGVKLSEGSKVTTEELMKICHNKLGHFKSPDHIYFLPDLPKGPSGKIQRIKLAELVSVE